MQPAQSTSALPSAGGFPSLQGGKIPALNGWRAVCISLVLLHHSKWVPGGPDFNITGFGGLGVRFFFVISGFLITVLMLREVATKGHLEVGAFFKRRCLRILPVYYAFLAAVFLLQLGTPYELSLQEWIGNLTFTKNYFGSDWTTGHLWSLAVEQQFYLLWPFAFRALAPLASPRRALAWLSLPMLLCPVLWAIGSITGIKGPLNLGSFFINADALATGCALAVLLWHWGDKVSAWFARKSVFLLMAGTFAVAASLWLAPQLRGVLFALTFTFPTLQNLGLALLLALSIQAGRSRLLAWLDWSWIAFIGTVSYSLYMWQQIFCTKPEVFGASPAWWNSFPLWVVAAFLAALASYYLVERPFLRMKRRHTSSPVESLRTDEIPACPGEK
ncbi:acyltransferase family protein [Luteolibacter luteus]|uniref:Acyltransferase n=1 Tax=Luteolibacter luteus TaxID=2728835 RepID=A0A858RJ74_9BACT|nr:acyltransferase [Luteolibacter luteus]QJE96967.1 acyltransferase [Luteolibacter luteus]